MIVINIDEKNVPPKIKTVKNVKKNVTKIKKNVCKRWIKNVNSVFVQQINLNANPHIIRRARHK